MNIKELITDLLDRHGEVKASEIVKATGFSRTYINRFFRELREKGVLTMVGKANKTRYIPASKKEIAKVRSSVLETYRILKNSDLNEDKVLVEIKSRTGIFENIPQNVASILDYAFTEMLNNAIEHSRSEKIEIRIEKMKGNIMFEVRDHGIGVFKNIMSKKGLNTELEAIQDILKGKETTEPDAHSGEGIFLTCRIGDIMTIQSFNKKLVFDNITEDIVVRDINKKMEGTKVVFSVSLDSEVIIGDIFRKYYGDSFSFDRTEVRISLYKGDSDYVSRSQARRLLTGLEKFKVIVLDFEGLDCIGQAFADEIYRVWYRNNPDKKIITKNAGSNVKFMVNRAQG